MSEAIHVRLATPQDIAALHPLAAADPNAAHWTQQQYADALAPKSTRKIWLIEESGQLGGFLVAQTQSDHWEIENVVIAPEVRRNGFGGRLTRELLHAAHNAGVREVWLEVRESNVAAQGLYRKTGFAETGRRPRYYNDPVEDAVLYKLTLPSR